MLIDVHCHLDHYMYKKDLKDVLARAQKLGIKVIAAGIDSYTNKLCLEIAEKYNNVFVSFGFYPADSLDREGYYEENPDAKITNVDEEIELIRKQKDNKKFVAIGEVGLDLFTGKDIEKQKQDFRKLIQLAIELDKPIVIHSRDAEAEALTVLEEYTSKIKPQKVILHCFSGKKALIREAVKKGYCFSIPTNIVRSSSFKQLVKIAPIEQIFTETDGPYLSPFKNEDKSFNRNEPANIVESIKVIAEVKQISQKDAEKALEDNFKRVFGVNI
jgi:TatD DNase family protein